MKTYSDFLDAEEAIASNILIDRLKHLVAQGIIEKSRDPDNRRSFVYSLTKKGIDLAPILFEIILWSGKYDDRSVAERAVLQELVKDRVGYEVKLREKAKSNH